MPTLPEPGRNPWIRLVDPGCIGASRELDGALQAAGCATYHLSGESMRTEHDLFEVFADAFEFPGYFGHNWSALDDCITDLAWLPPGGGFGIVIAAGDDVLARDTPATLGVFVRAMATASREWRGPTWEGPGSDRPPRRFIVALCLTENGVGRWRNAGADL